MQIPDFGHVWLLKPYIDFISGYFRQPCAIYFQLSTNKVVVVVVLLPLVQNWTRGHITNVYIFNLLCQLILWSYILETGLSKEAKTRQLLCDVKCLLYHSHISDSLQKYIKISRLHTVPLASRRCDDFVGNIRAGNNSRSSDILRPNFKNVRPISHYDRTWCPNISSTPHYSHSIKFS